ncbi:MAG: hypothetical protein JWN84_1147 [Nocardioides sp.]|nr:hypothetical protein [Nocardioides sp.]
MPDGPGVRAEHGTLKISTALSADPANVGRARGLLRQALTEAGAGPLIDDALLVLSEVVTNAFVHAGGDVRLQGWISAGALRVEVVDAAPHLPARRSYAATAGTGRGLQLMDELADRWGASPRHDGKVVWFEMGTRDDDGSVPAAGSGGPVGADGDLQVTLRNVPVLMHAAWQEHAATLLREYLLFALGEDDDIFDKHAHASSAMSLLSEQLPVPSLPEHAEALMAEAIEPGVTAPEVVLRVPVATVPHFATLDALLRDALAASRTGMFLSPPTQPEIDEMREWICAEVARQSGGDTTATPWLARTDVRATLADQAALTATYAHLAEVDEPLLATDEASIIVAASQGAVELLGYERADELLGRRVVVVVPTRFHQAHIAGTTFHATNGRDNLLDVSIEVPMVRADGSEVPVVIEVRAERFDEDRQVFVARFRSA